VDGPAGSGKEKIAKYISKKYKLFHLDSGILYRRVAKSLIDNKINYKNIKKIKIFLKSQKKISHRKHITLRSEHISKLTSLIAIYPSVRQFVNNQQKLSVSNILKKNKGCVIDGRDIGTKVFKNAKIKLFIDANIEIRAKRRHKQLIEQGEKSIYSHILKDLKLRDKTDINRKESPLRIPVGAIIIDNSKSFVKTKSQINKALQKF
tara:strand:- start:62 stop:679 length:618 start_codon:yes stop_codon:yes gene_type:complete